MKEHYYQPLEGGHITDFYNTPYHELAVAIVKQAVEDYVKVVRKLWNRKLTVLSKRNLLLEKTELEGFFYSNWYATLTDIDPDKLMARCKVIAVEKEKERIERSNKAKIKKLLEEKDGELMCKNDA